jgi:hypothetical protein
MYEVVPTGSATRSKAAALNAACTDWYAAWSVDLDALAVGVAVAIAALVAVSCD